MNPSNPNRSLNNHTVSLGHTSLQLLTASPNANTDATTAVQMHTQGLSSQAVPALHFLFGGDPLKETMKPSPPLCQLQGDGFSAFPLTGSQTLAIADATLHPMMDGPQLIGYWFDTDDARYCLLGNIQADNLNASRTAQTQHVFNKAAALLEQANMKFTHTIRTWFYLRDLLDWYDDFNALRTDFFRANNIFDHLVPASTGIGAGTPSGEALTCSLLAVCPKNKNVRPLAIPSPLQCPAIDYKSSFSRAIELQHGDTRLLMISGTASIAPSGNTVHLNNAAGQIELTMQVVDAILKSRKMNWNHTVRAIAYFKDRRDVPLFEEYCIANQIPRLPCAIAHATVCRDNLLFELELDAAQTNKNN